MRRSSQLSSESLSEFRSGRSHPKLRAALGFRAHSGWAAVVAVGGVASSPAVLDRRRIELVEPGVPKQPYHAAEGLDLAKAEKIIIRSIDLATRMARQALRELLAELQNRGYEVVGCGILQAAGRPLPELAGILASHALIHTAEGVLFRNALARASESSALPVTRVKERELYADAAVQLGLTLEKLQRRVAEMGKLIGPPWSQDQKGAALVGWLALLAAAR